MSSIPFAFPEKLEGALAEVKIYWDSLRRAENSMPFWDDFNPAALAAQADKILLIDVFAKPERFRFNTVADALMRRGGLTLTGKFIDEVDPADPFAFLRAQCSATVEARVPTYYQHAASSYSRILLPMWGEGRIGMLLGAVA